MRRLSLALISAVSALAVTQMASAADLPRWAPVYPQRVAVHDWTGCYIGLNGGWIGSTSTYDVAPGGSYLTPSGALAPPNAGGTGLNTGTISLLSNSYDIHGSGGLVGGQLGCNYAVGPFVFGAEADAQWTSLETSTTTNFGAFPDANPAFTVPAHTEQVSSKLRFLSTFRARTGFVWGNDLFLYATGGLAVADVESDTNVTFGTFAVSPVLNGVTHVGSFSDTRVGWVAGGGAEYAFDPHWTVKAEYLYVDLGSYSYNSPIVAAAAPAVVGPGYFWTTSVHEREHVARVGLNYKFY